MREEGGALERDKSPLPVCGREGQWNEGAYFSPSPIVRSNSPW